ncbi:MAG: hypothetical protein MJ241_06270 [Bacilli bacterium]|nr:hypothetical protein [Bacilli bacterium]
MEENKEIVEEVKTEPAPAAEDTKPALLAFIFAIIGATLIWIPFANIAGIVFAFIALKKAKGAANTQTNPFKVFVKIAKPLAIVGIIAGFIMAVVWVLWFFLVVVAGILAAIGAGIEAGMGTEAVIALLAL